MSAPDKDGWIEWAGGPTSPVPAGVSFRIRLRSGSDLVGCENSQDWTHDGDDSDIVAYKLPEPAQRLVESPIRAFTTWSANGRYAIGKGFRPSLQHLTIYLDAMERLEGWSLLQILEASSGSPSFVFTRDEQGFVSKDDLP